VHLWDPPFCGEMDILITKDGTWIHEDRPIRRQAMVRLFANILRLDDDHEYYLVTPVEKVRIKVEDCPFVVTQMERCGVGEEQVITFTTNTEERFTVDQQHCITVETDINGENPHPIVHVRNGLDALIGRSVFYRLVDLCEEHTNQKETFLGVWSNHQFFRLGNQEAQS